MLLRLFGETFGPAMRTANEAAPNSTSPVLELVLTNTGFGAGISGNVTVNALTGGTPYFFQVRGWTPSFGGFASYEEAQQHPADGVYLGVTPVGTITPAVVGSSSPVPELFGTGPGQVRTPILVDTPEPSTMLLGGLGVLALAFSRRLRRSK